MSGFCGTISQACHLPSNLVSTLSDLKSVEQPLRLFARNIVRRSFAHEQSGDFGSVLIGKRLM